MSDDIFRWVVAGGVTIAALCIVVQAVVVVILASTLKKTQVRVLALMDKAEPVVDSVRDIVDDIKPKIASISKDATAIVKTAREQVDRMSDVLKDVADRAKIQVARIDGAVDETLDQVHTAGGAVRTAILKPVREVNGFFTGLRTAISVYSQGNRASVDH